MHKKVINEASVSLTITKWLYEKNGSYRSNERRDNEKKFSTASTKY